MFVVPLFEPERPGGRPCGVISFLGHDALHSGKNPVTSCLPLTPFCNETVTFEARRVRCLKRCSGGVRTVEGRPLAQVDGRQAPVAQLERATDF